MVHRTLRRETFHTIYRGYARSAAIASIVTAGLIFLAGCGAPEPADRNASDTEAPRLIPDAAGKPNVVVILIDTLRADYLGAYGHEPETAPFLNRIAEQSALFILAPDFAPGLRERLADRGFVERDEFTVLARRTTRPVRMSELAPATGVQT